MLSRLTVRNLAVVEQAEARFAAGLNVITGETGAGKSVLMGALELVLGARADPEVVREGAKEAEVEADFGEHVFRRTITANGRSRAWIDDESVSIAELREAAGKLVDVHGPRANQRLLEESFQRDTLDAFGSVELTRYAEAWKRWREVVGRLEELAVLGVTEDEMDMLRFQVDELAGAEITSDDDTLSARHAAAAHAEELMENTAAITEALGGDESAASILASLMPRFSAVARHMPEAEAWRTEAEELTVRVQELSRTVADAASKMEAGEEDMEALDSRLTLINRLKRKYLKAVDMAADEERGDAERLLGVLSAKRQRLDDLEHRGERLEKLSAEAAAAEKEVRKEGAALTKKRQAAAEKLAKAVTKELHDLGFLKADFTLELRPAEPEAHGCDQVTYLFGPNPGEPRRPLASIASSGEIARVMLALKGILAAHDAAEVLVFDEIDANVGGEIGRVVGVKLKDVAKRRQVIAITHLPQCAAFGERHLVVAKSVAGGRTRTTISEAEGESRVNELARMLGGEHSSKVVKEHAEELLRLSR